MFETKCTPNLQSGQAGNEIPSLATRASTSVLQIYLLCRRDGAGLDQLTKNRLEGLQRTVQTVLALPDSTGDYSLGELVEEELARMAAERSEARPQ